MLETIFTKAPNKYSTNRIFSRHHFSPMLLQEFGLNPAEWTSIKNIQSGNLQQPINRSVEYLKNLYDDELLLKVHLNLEGEIAAAELMLASF